MKDKWDYMQKFQSGNTLRELALTLAAYAAFMEGLQLFASFAIRMNFPRFSKMKGIWQIVTWSVRDETLHVQSLIKLFHVMIDEHPSLMTPILKEEIRSICYNMVKHEDAFSDLAFEQGGIEGLTADEVKAYVRHITDRRLFWHFDALSKGIFKVFENYLANLSLKFWFLARKLS